MKTNNNAQKAGYRKFRKTLTVVLAVFFSSFSAESQDVSFHWFKNKTFNQTAQLENKQNSEINASLTISETIGYRHSNETSNKLSGLFTETEQEERLELESWMISNKYFSRTDSLFCEEIEETLKLEEWMTDKKFWGF